MQVLTRFQVLSDLIFLRDHYILHLSKYLLSQCYYIIYTQLDLLILFLYKSVEEVAQWHEEHIIPDSKEREHVRVVKSVHK